MEIPAFNSNVAEVLQPPDSTYVLTMKNIKENVEYKYKIKMHR